MCYLSDVGGALELAHVPSSTCMYFQSFDTENDLMPMRQRNLEWEGQNFQHRLNSPLYVSLAWSIEPLGAQVCYHREDRLSDWQHTPTSYISFRFSCWLLSAVWNLCECANIVRLLLVSQLDTMATANCQILFSVRGAPRVWVTLITYNVAMYVCRLGSVDWNLMWNSFEFIAIREHA